MSPEELIFSNCGAGEDFWKSLGQQVAYGMLSMEFTQNTGEGSLSFLQWIFPIQGLNPGLMHCRQILYQLSRGVTKSRTRLNNFTFTFKVKAMTNLDSILKSRDITLLTKVCLVKAMVVPVVMYGCESWTIKKAEHEELMLLNCGVEDSWESLGLQRGQTSQS